MGQICNVIWYAREIVEFLCEMGVNTARSGQRRGLSYMSDGPLHFVLGVG